LRSFIALGSGALLTLAFAPFDLWLLAILVPAMFFYSIEGATTRCAAKLGFYFGLGTFTAGTYWLYISINGFGGAPVWLALLLMFGLVIWMSSYYALLGFLATRFLPAHGLCRWVLGLPALWVLLEWFRGWFLSGFGWLSLGYSQTDTVLASFAPIGGIYLITTMLVLMAGALLAFVRGTYSDKIFATVLLLLPWVVALSVSKIQWTHIAGAPVQVALVQGAIPQDQKWLNANREVTLRRYRDLTMQALGTPLILWPESALPDLANNLVTFLDEIQRVTTQSGSTVVMGIIRAVPNAQTNVPEYFNSILVLGKQLSWYNKSHLVPFGEFFPIPLVVRDWLRLMSLPYSDFVPGEAQQSTLHVAGLVISPSICYEDAYPSAQLMSLHSATVMVNVTNDAWFGRSSARYQHLQISRMRAIEAQRYLLRVANDGVSAVIGPHGEIIARAAEFTPTVLRGVVVPRSGTPPFMKFGNWPILLLCALAAFFSLWHARNELIVSSRV